MEKLSETTNRKVFKKNNKSQRKKSNGFFP